MSLVVPGTVAASTLMGDLVPIGNIVGVNDNAGFSFNDVPQTFSHLYGVLTVQSSAGTAGVGGWLNGDTTGSNYSFTFLRADGSTVSSSRSTNSSFSPPAGQNLNINSPTTMIMYMPNYRWDKFKNIFVFTASDQNGSGFILLNSILYRSTNPISSIFFSTFNGSVFLTTKSSFELYGIR